MVYNSNKNGPKGVFARIAAVIIVLGAVGVLVTSAEGGDFGDSFGRFDETKTFFFQFVIAGGPIVWFILIPMSVAMVYLVIELCFTIRKSKLLPANIAGDILKLAQRFGLPGLVSKISERTDLVSGVVSGTIIKSQNLSNESMHIQHLAAEALQDRALGLLRKVEWCNIIGNVAPMVGLFGTVFGMIKAFNILGIAEGQPRPDQLAAAISVALVTTFWGLLIAIPALAMYGVFQSRIEALVSEAAVEIETVLLRITPLASGVQRVVPEKRDISSDKRQDRGKVVKPKGRDDKDRLSVKAVS